ncbi:MAG: flagellar basal body-associated FliL family protein, partial [Pseudomonadota bacterium]
IPDQGAVSSTQPSKALFDLGSLVALFLTVRLAAQKQFTRLQSLPIFVRIALYAALPLLLAGIFLAVSLTSTPPQALRPATTSLARHPDGAALSKTSGGLGGVGQASLLHPGKIRKKWAFPAFIIPVNNPASDQPVTFVLVDITLIASLNEQEEPPAGKKTFVRDIIYQFFQNKPLEELRRFSLARGEMNKELRAWLLKQWPEAPIESIIFNQYHLS